MSTITDRPQPMAAHQPGTADEVAGLRQAQGRLFWAWLFTLPILLIMAASRAFGAPWPSPLLKEVGMLALAFPVLFVVGAETLRSALRSARSHTISLDTLIALGALAAYTTGIMSLFAPVGSYAGVAAMIMAFYLTGRYIEDRARN